MLPSIEYATILQYSPKGETALCEMSRKVRNDFKAGRLDQYKTRIGEIISEHQHLLAPFLGRNVTLVPVPRSSPIRPDYLWPSLEIAKVLSGLTPTAVSTCLHRHAPVRKAAFHSTAQGRPSVQEHYDTFSVDGLVPTGSLTLVDDILTQGRTAMAAASRLKDAFPGATIRLLAILRAKGLDKAIDTILNVRVDTITYNPTTGKSHLTP